MREGTKLGDSVLTLSWHDPVKTMISNSDSVSTGKATEVSPSAENTVTEEIVRQVINVCIIFYHFHPHDSHKSSLETCLTMTMTMRSPGAAVSANMRMM